MVDGVHALSSMTAAINWTLAAEIALAGLLTAGVGAWARRRPGLLPRVFARFETLAERPAYWIASAMFVAVVVRLALLPWLPPPVPRLHDEFGHLLVADTLLSGRLANPVHPLWRHLETIYVFQQPRYASTYPIGQGLILAAGDALFGHPWAGVLLAVALMGGAICWMFYACLPPRWAAAGGVLAAVHYGLARPWIDTYWGGAFCAFGGALVFGALFRLWKVPSAKQSAVAGIGWSIVCLIRPFESVLLWLVSWIALGTRVLRGPETRRRWILPVALFASTQMLALVVTLAHNRAVTGSIDLLPYQLSQQVYGFPQTLFRHPPLQPPRFSFAEAEKTYWWQRVHKDRADRDPVGRFGNVLYESWTFFVTPWYSLPLLLLVPALRNPAVLAGAGFVLCVLVTSALYPFFFPHYIAAYSGLIFLLIVAGLMRLWRASIGGARVGGWAAVFLIAGGTLMGLRIVPVRQMLGRAEPYPYFRHKVSAHLLQQAGRDVVFVRYGRTHPFHDEWVYNGANVDAEPIVWLRSIDGDRDAAARRYYGDRRCWTVDVEEYAARLSPHPAAGSELQGRQELVLVRKPGRHSQYPRR